MKPSSLLLAPALAATLATTLAGCTTENSPAGPAPSDDGLAHVHGLGVDPADGTLYAASHFGVFSIDEDGVASRVADRWQDTMAFTVTGPNTFLASGHPDLREDLPPQLGLLESTDAAETWESVSLGGEADFHALEVAGDTLFGFDSVTGTLMATTNRTDWTEIAATPVFDLAWLGEEDGSVLATTPSGLVEYDAGGGSTTLKGPPGLVLVDAPEPGTLAGVSEAGEVYLSTDPLGGRWRQRGTVPGTPQAFDTAVDAWHVATDDGIFASDDKGRSWDLGVALDGDAP